MRAFGKGICDIGLVANRATKDLLEDLRIVSIASESVPKSTVSGTPIVGVTEQRHCWVSEPSFSEGFRNRDMLTPGHTASRRAKPLGSAYKAPPHHVGLAISVRRGRLEVSGDIGCEI
jgi:hypothetical protein